MEGTVRVLEHKLDGIAGTRPVTERLRKPSAELLQPMHDVAVAGVIVSDEHHRLVRGGDCCVLHMDQQKLVVQNPLCPYAIFNCPAPDLAGQFPVPDQLFEQVIAEDPVWAIEWILTRTVNRHWTKTEAEDSHCCQDKFLYHVFSPPSFLGFFELPVRYLQ